MPNLRIKTSNGIEETFNGITNIGVKDTSGTVQNFVYPNGIKNITQNGTYDVTNYASANVNVSGGGGLVEMDCSIVDIMNNNIVLVFDQNEFYTKFVENKAVGFYMEAVCSDDSTVQLIGSYHIGTCRFLGEAHKEWNEVTNTIFDVQMSRNVYMFTIQSIFGTVVSVNRCILFQV